MERRHIRAREREGEDAVGSRPITAPSIFFPHFQWTPQEIRAGLCQEDDDVKARSVADAGNGIVEANGRRCPKCGAMIEYLCHWERGRDIPGGLLACVTPHIFIFHFRGLPKK